MVFTNSVPDVTTFKESPCFRGDQEAISHAADIDSHLSARCKDQRLSYDMTGNKTLIIFNHYRYSKTRYYKFVPGTRRGTYEDVKRLESTFRRRGFLVITHDDWKYADIMSYLSDVCAKDHSKTSCIAIAVMSHGKGSHLCASDRLYPVSDITNLLTTAPSLFGKPKLFFIQACRGGHTSPRVMDVATSVPADADCLVLYSSYEGTISIKDMNDIDYVSYRNKNGSWLMQAVCTIVESYQDSMDLGSMVTLINRMVAAKYAGCGWDGKQTPVAEFRLTKFLWL